MFLDENGEVKIVIEMAKMGGSPPCGATFIFLCAVVPLRHP